MMTSVYVNGPGWTAGPAKPTAEAFTVRDGRLLASRPRAMSENLAAGIASISEGHPETNLPRASGAPSE